MNKTEKLLREQIKELQKLLELKDQRIVELQTVRNQSLPQVLEPPRYPQIPYLGPTFWTTASRDITLDQKQTIIDFNKTHGN
jgi:hypothetical protein